MNDPLYIKIQMEAGNGQRVYQRTTFEQFYNDGLDQIADQSATFPSVAATVVAEMQKATDRYLAKAE